MDDGMKGTGGGDIFSGVTCCCRCRPVYLASRWSAKKLIAIFSRALGARAAVGLRHGEDLSGV